MNLFRILMSAFLFLGAVSAANADTNSCMYPLTTLKQLNPLYKFVRAIKWLPIILPNLLYYSLIYYHTRLWNMYHPLLTEFFPHGTIK